MRTGLQQLLEFLQTLSWPVAVLLAALAAAGVGLGYEVIGPALFG